MDVIIKEIKIKLGKRTLKLSFEDIKELKDILNKNFGDSSYVTYTMPAAIPTTGYITPAPYQSPITSAGDTKCTLER